MGKVIVACVLLAGCSEDRRQLCPQPDITAYELAILVARQYDVDHMLIDNPSLGRHVTKVGECDWRKE